MMWNPVGASALNIMNTFHAVLWSHSFNDGRDRSSHHQVPMQRAQEWRTFWNWEEEMAVDKTLPWKQAEAARGERRRDRESRTRFKHERQPPQKIGGHTEWAAEPRCEPEPVRESDEEFDARLRREVLALRALQSGRAEVRVIRQVPPVPVPRIRSPVRLHSPELTATEHRTDPD